MKNIILQTLDLSLRFDIVAALRDGPGWIPSKQLADEAQLNRTLLETITHHTPAGSSTRYNLDKYYYKIVPIIDTVNMHFGICTLRKN